MIDSEEPGGIWWLTVRSLVVFVELQLPRFNRSFASGS